MRVDLPYGEGTLSFNIPDKSLLAVLEPRNKEAVSDPYAEVLRALKSPVGTRRLMEIAKPGDKVSIVIDDATRRTPSHIMIPPILKELNQAGVKEKDITIIVGCGSHRKASPSEIKRLVGEGIVKAVKVVNHDCDASDLIYIGKTSLGQKST